MKKLIYIAGPFRGKDGWIVNCNIHEAEKAAAIIVEDGRAFPVVPHSGGAHFDRCGTDEYWLDGTLELMRRCDAVLALPSWQSSTGAKGEIAEAEQMGLPVFYSHDSLFRWLAL